MARPVLTVIAGGPDTGKSLIAEALVAYRGQAMIARDHVRALLQHQVDEWIVTLTTFAMARELLRQGVSVCAVGWNLEPGDRAGWLAVAREAGAECRWVEVEVAGQCPFPRAPGGAPGGLGELRWGVVLDLASHEVF